MIWDNDGKVIKIDVETPGYEIYSAKRSVDMRGRLCYECDAYEIDDDGSWRTSCSIDVYPPYKPGDMIPGTGKIEEIGMRREGTRLVWVCKIGM